MLLVLLPLDPAAARQTLALLGGPVAQRTPVGQESPVAQCGPADQLEPAAPQAANAARTPAADQPPVARHSSTALLSPSVDSLTPPPSIPDSSAVAEGVDTGRLAIVGGLTAATMVGIHVYQSNGWWKNNRTPFHFQEDLEYGMWVDKLGHFYGATVASFILRKSFEWTNMSAEQSLWFGSAGAVLFQTYVEVQDGFSAWGFDRVDFAANVAGALYPVAQFYWPPLQDFNMKFSYHPSDLLEEPGGIGFQGQKHILFDDYEGQTIWMSVYVNNLLPRSVEPVWPDWLAIAVGYGVRDVATPNPYSIVMLSLDYDLRKIIPQDTGFLRLLSEALNFIHWPAPAVRISPNAVWYGLYF